MYAGFGVTTIVLNDGQELAYYWCDAVIALMAACDNGRAAEMAPQTVQLMDPAYLRCLLRCASPALTETAAWLAVRRLRSPAETYGIQAGAGLGNDAAGHRRPDDVMPADSLTGASLPSPSPSRGFGREPVLPVNTRTSIKPSDPLVNLTIYLEDSENGIRSGRHQPQPLIRGLHRIQRSPNPPRRRRPSVSGEKVVQNDDGETRHTAKGAIVGDEERAPGAQRRCRVQRVRRPEPGHGAQPRRLFP